VARRTTVVPNAEGVPVAAANHRPIADRGLFDRGLADQKTPARDGQVISAARDDRGVSDAGRVR